MYLFIACIVFLYVWSLVFKGRTSTFRKEKVFPLKGVLSILIVAHHITFEVDCLWLSPFHFWGAPIVSIYFFISGYGLMRSYATKGNNYLKGFLYHRIFRVVIIPFLLALVLYRCLVPDLSPIIEAVQLLIFKGLTALPHSWYVFAIIVFYVFFYISCRIGKKGGIVSLTLMCIAYSIATKSLGYDRCWYITALAFPAGAFYAGYGENIILTLKSILSYLVIPVSLLLATILYFLHYEWAYSCVYVLIPFMVITLCTKLEVEKLGDFTIIRWLSKHSYEIYLCQGIAMSLCSLRKDFFSPVEFYVLSVFILTFLFAYVVKRVGNVIMS